MVDDTDGDRPSNGEAEYCGVTKGACESLGVVGVAQGIGLVVGIHTHTDSFVDKGIATRIGIGRVDGLDTRTLWVHDKDYKGS